MSDSLATRPQGRGRPRTWVVRALLVVGGLAVITAFAAIEKTHPRPLPALLFVAALVAVLGLLADSSGADPADWSPESDYGATAAGVDPGLAGNARLLENHLSARVPDHALQLRLARMTGDRLARLGLTRGDPLAERRLGPVLTAVLDGPPRRLRREEIEECIRRIEELAP